MEERKWICGEVMTRNPICCTPEDRVRDVARQMEKEKLGPIPVVDDQRTRRLVGIVTDRDLALKVVAQGRDPKSTRIKDVMTRKPVACRAEKDIEECLALMEKHQVRRVPIVDDGNRIIGIIAQADIATRLGRPEKTAELVELVSQRAYSGNHANSGGGLSRGQSLAIAGGVGLGLGLMYMLDPSKGSERRAAVGKAVARASREVGGRVVNASHEIRTRLTKNGEPQKAEREVAQEALPWLPPKARILAGATGGALAAAYGVRRWMSSHVH